MPFKAVNSHSSGNPSANGEMDTILTGGAESTHIDQDGATSKPKPQHLEVLYVLNTGKLYGSLTPSDISKASYEVAEFNASVIDQWEGYIARRAYDIATSACSPDMTPYSLLCAESRLDAKSRLTKVLDTAVSADPNVTGPITCSVACVPNMSFLTDFTRSSDLKFHLFRTKYEPTPSGLGMRDRRACRIEPWAKDRIPPAPRRLGFSSLPDTTRVEQFTISSKGNLYPGVEGQVQIVMDATLASHPFVDSVRGLAQHIDLGARPALNASRVYQGAETLSKMWSENLGVLIMVRCDTKARITDKLGGRKSTNTRIPVVLGKDSDGTSHASIGTFALTMKVEEGVRVGQKLVVSFDRPRVIVSPKSATDACDTEPNSSMACDDGSKDRDTIICA